MGLVDAVVESLLLYLLLSEHLLVELELVSTVEEVFSRKEEACARR